MLIFMKLWIVLLTVCLLWGCSTLGDDGSYQPAPVYFGTGQVTVDSFVPMYSAPIYYDNSYPIQLKDYTTLVSTGYVYNSYPIYAGRQYNPKYYYQRFYSPAYYRDNHYPRYYTPQYRGQRIYYPSYRNYQYRAAGYR